MMVGSVLRPLVVWIITKSEGFMDRGVCGCRRVMIILSRRSVN